MLHCGCVRDGAQMPAFEATAAAVTTLQELEDDADLVVRGARYAAAPYSTHVLQRWTPRCSSQRASRRSSVRVTR